MTPTGRRRTPAAAGAAGAVGAAAPATAGGGGDDDPFDTAGLRRAVLGAWRASPARLREDANAEEALVLGGYAGRAIAEVVGNGVDAARSAGEPARIRVALHGADGAGGRSGGAELRIANNGAPLTAAGVAALASLRASAKRGVGALGHFGVGFTAVLTVTDAPTMLSATGGVRFDAAAGAELVRELGASAVDEQVSARAGHLAVLRLPLPARAGADDPVPAGYTTEVRLPLRPEVVAAVAVQVQALGADLFWALPELTELTVVTDGPRAFVRSGATRSGPVTITATAGAEVSSTRFLVATRTGELDPALLADRPVEERDRTAWRISWVLGPGTAGHTLGAPLPTDEPLSGPARLVGTFPVDETRRRLAPGPATDVLLAAAADTYLDLVAAAPAPDRPGLAPAGGFPRGPVDEALRAGVLDGFTRRPVLLSVSGDLVTAAQACRLPDATGDLLDAVAQACPGLLPPAQRGDRDAFRALGVRELTPAEVTAALAALDRPAPFWHRVYAGLADVYDPEEWADLPVPVVTATGTRLRIGARGTLLPGGLPEDVVARLAAAFPGLPQVDPAAAHEFLIRIGARPADPTELLDQPAVRDRLQDLHDAAADGDVDLDEVDAVATAVLDLIAAGARPAGPLPLLLTDADGEPWPAAELLLPGAPLAAVLRADADLPMVDGHWRDTYSDDVLRTAGVRWGPALVRVRTDAAGLDAARDALPDFDEWLAGDPGDLAAGDVRAGDVRAGDGGAGDGGTGDFAAVADLDLVDDAAWPALFALIAGDRDVRAALVAGGRRGYSGWWLSRFAVLAGRPPWAWRTPAATGLTGLYDEVPVSAAPELLAAVGVLADFDDAARDPAELLRRYADPARPVPPAAVPRLTAVVVGLLADPGLDLPDRVRVCTGEAVPADDAVVLDAPWWAQVLPPDRLVPGGPDPAATAAALELPMAGDEPARVVPRDAGSGAPPVPADPPADPRGSGPAGRPLDPEPEFGADPVAGTPDPVPGRARAAAALGVAAPAMRVATALAVRTGDRLVPVRWWPGGAHWWVDGSAEGVGRAVAWAAGRWSDCALACAAAGGNAGLLAETVGAAGNGVPWAEPPR